MTMTMMMTMMTNLSPLYKTFLHTIAATEEFGYSKNKVSFSLKHPSGSSLGIKLWLWLFEYLLTSS
jgi:hypothetical protein